MRVQDSIDAYVASLEQRGRKPATVRQYRVRLASFRAKYGELDLEALTREQLAEHLERQRTFADGRPKAPDTVRADAVALEQWQKWGVGAGHLAAPLLVGLKKPKGRERDQLPTPEESQRILAHGAEDFRDVYRALRLTGARPGELVGAQIEDIDSRAGEIVLRDHKTAGKTGKPRRIAIGHAALKEILARQIGERRTGPIFRRSSGRAWTVPALSTAYRTARRAAGLPEGLVLYLARHEHATQLYRQTQDLKAVADALGHTQLSTTMRYTRVESETLKKHQQLFDEGFSEAADPPRSNEFTQSADPGKASESPPPSAPPLPVRD